jgi:hypothetical protein
LTSFGKEEKTWSNRAGLVGLFEVEWKTPHHNFFVEFLNNWKLDFEHNKINSYTTIMQLSLGYYNYYAISLIETWCINKQIATLENQLVVL